MPRAKCPCPIYCKYCGAHRRRDHVGHYCPTKTCDQHHGFKGCTLHEAAKRGAKDAVAAWNAAHPVGLDVIAHSSAAVASSP